MFIYYLFFQVVSEKRKLLNTALQSHLQFIRIEH